MQFNKLCGEFLVVEEKLDGTGVSIFFDSDFQVQVWHRGSPAVGKEFHDLKIWASELHKEHLFDLLEDRYILFGEWLRYKHNIFYDRLPHAFFESDIYDLKENKWLNTIARADLLKSHDSHIASVPVIAAFKPTTFEQLTSLVGKSLYQSEDWRNALEMLCRRQGLSFEEVLKQTDQSSLAEGLYIKHENDKEVLGRYKYVRREFIQTIVDSGTHLKDRIPIHNELRIL